MLDPSNITEFNILPSLQTDKTSDDIRVEDIVTYLSVQDKKPSTDEKKKKGFIEEHERENRCITKMFKS